MYKLYESYMYDDCNTSRLSGAGGVGGSNSSIDKSEIGISDGYGSNNKRRRYAKAVEKNDGIGKDGKDGKDGKNVGKDESKINNGDSESPYAHYINYMNAGPHGNLYSNVNLPSKKEIDNIRRKHRNDKVVFSNTNPISWLDADSSNYNIANTHFGSNADSKLKFQGSVKHTFKPHKCIDVNFIFVNKAVIEQWKVYLNENTTLNTFYIDNVYRLREFVEMFARCDLAKDFSEIERYDIIVLKNDKVSAAINYYQLPVEVSNCVNNPHIMMVLCNIMRGYIVRRTFYDDFDTIGIPEDAGYIASCYNYIISASQNEVKKRKYIRQYPTFDEHIKYMYDRILTNMTFNNVVFHNFSINADNDFVNSSARIAAPVFEQHIVKNPNANYVNALNAIGEVNNAGHIVDLINSDCQGQACAEVGINAGSVADIF